MTSPAEARAAAICLIGAEADALIADLIVIEGDPRADLSALQRVRHTLVGGRLMCEAGRLCGAAAS